ncbi:PQQ-binding-like beta-propeller repeat protein [candidate division KSB1 bacterium]|nr:PQQ-binding-like beta-propeller repeat protein [candidate division KSB1 bacterium]
MKSIHKYLIDVITIVLITVSVLFLIYWFRYEPRDAIVLHVPGMDGQPDSLALASNLPAVRIGEHFEQFDGAPGTITGSWPRFRGANFDNISREKIRLAESWPDGGPPVLWSVDLGEGHAAPAVHNGRVYVIDYDEENSADALRCFSLDTGNEIWRRWYEVHVKRNHGMSRTIPAVNDSFVVTIGPRCHVMCVKAQSGNFVWGIDLEREYGAREPLWYTGQCPLIDDSTAVIAPGGSVLMLGVHLKTGRILWQVPNPNQWQMSHSSIIPFTIHGRRTYIYCTVDGVIGVQAEGEDRGALLWTCTAWAHSVIAPSPVLIGENRLFFTAGYGAGSMVIQVNFNNGEFSTEVVAEYPPSAGLASEQQTPILYENHLYGIMPKDAGTYRNQLVCVDPADCRKIIWSSDKQRRFGMGPYILADNKFYILNDDGLLTVAKVNASSYNELSSVQVLNGHDAWGPMALVNGRLLLRDSKEMVCVDIRAGK